MDYNMSFLVEFWRIILDVHFKSTSFRVFLLISRQRSLPCIAIPRFIHLCRGPWSQRTCLVWSINFWLKGTLSHFFLLFAFCVEFCHFVIGFLSLQSLVLVVKTLVDGLLSVALNEIVRNFAPLPLPIFICRRFSGVWSERALLNLSHFLLHPFSFQTLLLHILFFEENFNTFWHWNRAFLCLFKGLWRVDLQFHNLV